DVHESEDGIPPEIGSYADRQVHGVRAVATETEKRFVRIVASLGAFQSVGPKKEARWGQSTKTIAGQHCGAEACAFGDAAVDPEPVATLAGADVTAIQRNASVEVSLDTHVLGWKVRSARDVDEGRHLDRPSSLKIVLLAGGKSKNQSE